MGILLATFFTLASDVAGTRTVLGFNFGFGTNFCGRISAFGSGIFGIGFAVGGFGAGGLALGGAGGGGGGGGSLFVRAAFFPALPCWVYHPQLNLSLALTAQFPSQQWVVRQVNRA